MSKGSDHQFFDFFILLFFSKANLLEADVWKEFLARPSLPYVLRLLSGLCKGHANTQVQWSDRFGRGCTDVTCRSPAGTVLIVAAI